MKIIRKQRSEGKTKNELILEEGQEAVDEYVKSVKVVNFLVDNAVKKVVNVDATAAQSESAIESKAESTEAAKESSSNQCIDLLDDILIK